MLEFSFYALDFALLILIVPTATHSGRMVIFLYSIWSSLTAHGVDLPAPKVSLFSSLRVHSGSL